MATKKKDAKDTEDRVEEIQPEAEELTVGEDEDLEWFGRHELRPLRIHVTRRDEVEWRLYLRNAPARALLRLANDQGHRDIVDQRVPPPNPLRARVMPPPPSPGDYALIWSLLVPTGSEWQMGIEVVVNGTVVFRHFKSHQSQQPIPRGFLYVRVR